MKGSLVPYGRYTSDSGIFTRKAESTRLHSVTHDTVVLPHEATPFGVLLPTDSSTGGRCGRFSYSFGTAESLNTLMTWRRQESYEYDIV